MPRGRKTYMTKGRIAAVAKAKTNEDDRFCGLCGDANPYARGLCHACYAWAQRNHMVHMFDSPEYRRRQPERPTVCLCAIPVEEPLPVWGAVQCGQCGRPIMVSA